MVFLTPRNDLAGTRTPLAVENGHATLTKNQKKKQKRKQKKAALASASGASGDSPSETHHEDGAEACSVGPDASVGESSKTSDACERGSHVASAPTRYVP